MLTGEAIKNAILTGDIMISDFDEKRLNPNSYNLRLGDKLLVYKLTKHNLAIRSDHDKCIKFGNMLYECTDDLMNTNYLDPRKDNPTIEYPIPENGFILYPGELYLGTTMERTFTEKYVPMISGRSSIGRLGIDIHKTAGFGDIGFDGKWTLEIVATVPVLVYPGMEICQIYFESPEGPTGIKYNGRYQNQENVERSRFFLDFNLDFNE